MTHTLFPYNTLSNIFKTLRGKTFMKQVLNLGLVYKSTVGSQV